MRDGAGLTDAQLLELFISQKDQAAFEALVRRHGSMVLQVCNRVIRNHHDAEDAYQATFLLLARKASSVKSRERIANWLHGVAFRTALKAKSLRAKTQMWERQLTHMPEPQAVQQEHHHDLHVVLDQELSRLADIYRLPILLCDLEGKSIKKVAQQLGWPQGTVAGRLARGRKLLAKRLARHGLAITSGVVVLQNSASAGVSPFLVASTVKAAGAIASGQSAATGLISANVAILMKGAMSAMSFTKLKIAAAVLVMGSVFALGGGVLLNGTAGGQQAGEARAGEEPAKGQADQRKNKADSGKNDANTAKTAHEKLRGTWKVVEWKSGGKEQTIPKDLTWSIGKDKMVMTLRNSNESPTHLDRARVISYLIYGDLNDSAPPPNNIDLTKTAFINGMFRLNATDMEQVTMRGIFALEGDRLKLCFRPLLDGERPSEIKDSSPKDDNLHIIVLQRENSVPKTDDERLQGDWKVVGGEMDGKEIDVSKYPHMSFVGDLMEDGREAVFRLDSTKRLKQITAVYIFRNVEEKCIGIYSLDGDDLKICRETCNPKDKNYTFPDDFTTTNGSGRGMFILKRAKFAKEGAPSSQVQGRVGGKPAEMALPKEGTEITERKAHDQTATRHTDQPMDKAYENDTKNTVTILKDRQLRPGDRFQVEKRQENKFEFFADDEQRLTQKTNEDFAYQETVLEITSDGEPRRIEWRYERAERMNVEGKLSLYPFHGKAVVIEKKDGKFKFRLKDGGDLTDKDLEALHREFNSSEATTVSHDSFPFPKAVRINEAWQINLDAWIRDLKHQGVDIDAAGTVGTGKLENIYSRDGRTFGVFKIQVEAPIKAMTLTINEGADRVKTENVPLESGSKLVIEETVEKCIDGGPQDQKSKMVARQEIIHPKYGSKTEVTAHQIRKQLSPD